MTNGESSCRRRGRSRTARRVTTQQVYRDIDDLNATLFQMRKERLDRQTRGGSRFSPCKKVSASKTRARGRCFSPVTRWKTRERMGRSVLQSPIGRRSPDECREVLRYVSRRRIQLEPEKNYRRSVSRGRDLIRAVHRSASRGRSMQKEERKLVETDEKAKEDEPVQQQTKGKLGQKSTVTPGMTLAERTKVRLEEKQRKLERIKQEMMEGCTFTPETNHSSSATNSTQSHGSSNWKTTWKQPTLVTPQASKVSGIVSPPKVVDAANRISPESLGKSSVGTGRSNRIQELYLDGVRRNRALTDKTEDELRKRRLEEKELAQCTFKPNLNWRKKKPPASKPKISIGYNPRLVPKNSGSESSMGTLTLCSVNDMPPIEIVSKRPNTGYETPPQVTIIVSDDGIDKFLSKAAVNKRLAPEFEAACSVNTEYGSV